MGKIKEARIRKLEEAVQALQREKGGIAQSSSYKEKDFALPEKDNTGDSLHVDLHGKLHLSAELACRQIYETARTARVTITHLKADETPGWGVVEELDDALAHIVFLARCGFGVQLRPGPGDVVAKPGQFVWPPVVGSPRPTEAFIKGRGRYPVNSAEESAWTNGYTTGLEDFDQYAENLIERVLQQREDPPVHPGPVAGDAAGE